MSSARRDTAVVSTRLDNASIRHLASVAAIDETTVCDFIRCAIRDALEARLTAIGRQAVERPDFASFALSVTRGD